MNNKPCMNCIGKKNCVFFVCALTKTHANSITATVMVNYFTCVLLTLHKNAMCVHYSV